MEKFTIDFTNKLFIAKAGVVDFNVQEHLYSDAKVDWLLGGNAMQHLFPIRVVGGDPTQPGEFAGDIYFLINGWQLRADEVDHELNYTGNLYHDDAISLFVPTLGAFTVLAQGNRSNLVLTRELPGSSAAIADAVWAVLMDGAVDAKEVMKRLNAWARGIVNKTNPTSDDDLSYLGEDGLTEVFKNRIGTILRSPQ